MNPEELGWKGAIDHRLVLANAGSADDYETPLLALEAVINHEVNSQVDKLRAEARELSEMLLSAEPALDLALKKSQRQQDHIKRLEKALLLLKETRPEGDDIRMFTERALTGVDV